jgi:hypothetical protein
MLDVTRQTVCYSVCYQWITGSMSILKQKLAGKDNNNNNKYL